MVSTLLFVVLICHESMHTFSFIFTFIFLHIVGDEITSNSARWSSVNVSQPLNFLDQIPDDIPVLLGSNKHEGEIFVHSAFPAPMPKAVVSSSSIVISLIIFFRIQMHSSLFDDFILLLDYSIGCL